mgnify:CR=1 FL=1
MKLVVFNILLSHGMKIEKALFLLLWKYPLIICFLIRLIQRVD